MLSSDNIFMISARAGVSAMNPCQLVDAFPAGRLVCYTAGTQFGETMDRRSMQFHILES